MTYPLRPSSAALVGAIILLGFEFGCSDDAVFGNDQTGGAAGGPTAAGAGGAAGDPVGGDGTAGTGARAGAGGATGADGRCIVALEAVGEHLYLPCPATLGAADAWLDSCESPMEHRWSGTCGGLLAASFSGAVMGHDQTCYYDASSRRWVGAYVSSDVSGFCDRSSITVSAGQYPAECQRDGLTYLGACSEEATRGAAGAAGAGGAEATDPCTGTFEEVLDRAWTDCPATYDAAQPWLEFCEAGSDAWLSRYSGQCGDFMAAVLDWGTHGQTCYYDAATRGFVGLAVGNDVPSYCEYESFSIRGGQYPSQCPTAELTALGTCDAAGGAGGSGGQGPEVDVRILSVTRDGSDLDIEWESSVPLNNIWFPACGNAPRLLRGAGDGWGPLTDERPAEGTLQPYYLDGEYVENGSLGCDGGSPCYTLQGPLTTTLSTLEYVQEGSLPSPEDEGQGGAGGSSPEPIPNIVSRGTAGPYQLEVRYMPDSCPSQKVASIRLDVPE